MPVYAYCPSLDDKNGLFQDGQGIYAIFFLQQVHTVEPSFYSLILHVWMQNASKLNLNDMFAIFQV